MKKIAIFVDNLNVGGIQKSLVNMLQRMDYQKYEIDLYIFDNDFFYTINNHVNVIKLSRPCKLLNFLPFNIAKKIYKTKIPDKKYDVAIDFDSYQMHTAIGTLNILAQKHYIWVHNDVQIKLKNEIKYRILHFFFKKKYRFFDGYCAVSNGALASFKALENYPDKEYHVIPNYINTDEIKTKMQEKNDLKVDPNKINIVSVGRLVYQKGFDIMLENIKKLTLKRQDFHLYIIGDGPLRQKLTSYCEELAITDYVTFLGNQKNPFSFLKKMDLFYLSSRYEGQGMVILEALAVGLDVIIPKHLEKYCPLVKGSDDVLKDLSNYSKKKNKKFNDLEKYNADITKKLAKIFD